MQKDQHSDQEIKSIYNNFKNIAVVGMSKNEEKPAHYVPEYLISKGYNVIPVNPTVTEILGRKSYPSILDVKEPIDVVDIFRKSEDVLPIVLEAIKKKDGIKVIWMQEGIHNREAEQKASENGIDVVYNRCMMEEHKRLFGN